MYDQNSSQFQPKAAIWRYFHTWRNCELPPRTRRWLLDQGSLTQRLVEASGNRFEVQVINQRWDRAPLCDSRFLHIPPRSRCLIREVALLCGGEPWVYARSVLPHSSLTGPLRHLRHFDNRSLGELLFASPSLQRSPFQLAKCEYSHLPSGLQNEDMGVFWGRRSRFLLEHKPLLVSEIFLPAFSPWTDCPEGTAA